MCFAASMVCVVRVSQATRQRRWLLGPPRAVGRCGVRGPPSGALGHLCVGVPMVHGQRIMALLSWQDCHLPRTYAPWIALRATFSVAERPTLLRTSFAGWPRYPMFFANASAIVPRLANSNL